MSKVIDGIVKDIKTVPEKLKAEIGKVDKKKFFLMNLPYFLIGYFCDKIAWLWRVSPGQNASDKMLATMNGLEDLFANPLPSFFPKDLLIGIGCGIALRLVVYFKTKNAKKFRQGVEYGSARWGTAKDIEPYVDPIFENNVLLTETERLMMSGRPKEPKYARNKNILVIGGSGSGKTRFFVKPNLMQMHSSYVVTDPNGYI
ncbi:MAG: type IV secretory system conjugative DNA transfer family protein [Agathobacter sp.]|nr:type IV secretory system conjugative DNA transfer family protein [Agathobacter sp.]